MKEVADGIMIRLGNQVRLASRDVERITQLTGRRPAAVLCVEELDKFLDDQLALIRGDSKWAQVLRTLIDRERVKQP